MAEGLLRRSFRRAGLGVVVRSAGLMAGGVPATPDAVATMAARGVDIAAHRSRRLDADLARTTPLIVGMARMHVREACATYGAPLASTFTLKELVRRGEQAGARAPGEDLAAWLARVGAGRRPSDLIRDDPADDVADPIGRPRADYEATADELEDLLDRLFALLAGGGTGGGPVAYADPTCASPSVQTTPGSP
jgi:protein-tyrosine phosphatase